MQIAKRTKFELHEGLSHSVEEGQLPGPTVCIGESRGLAYVFSKGCANATKADIGTILWPVKITRNERTSPSVDLRSLDMPMR